MNNPPIQVTIIIDNVVAEYEEAEIDEHGNVIVADGCVVPVSSQQANAVEEVWQKHEAHLRDEAHYQRELADTDNRLRMCR